MEESSWGLLGQSGLFQLPARPPAGRITEHVSLPSLGVSMLSECFVKRLKLYFMGHLYTQE